MGSDRIKHMIEVAEFRATGQQFLTAAWELAHATTTAADDGAGMVEFLDAIEEVTAEYGKARADEEFLAELDRLQRHYTGRPSPVYEATRLTAHVRLLTTLGTPAIGLSNSVASQAALGAYLPHRQPEDIACTLLRTRAAKRSRLPGLFAASRLAQHVGITHRIFRWETLDEKHPLALAVAATYPDLEHPFGRAVAWWGSLVDDAVQLLDRAPDLELLQAGGRTASEGEHSPLRPSELQLACQEADFSHRALLTFNDRRLLELLCSVPANGRRRQALLRRFVADHPELVPPPTWGEQLQAAEQDG